MLRERKKEGKEQRERDRQRARSHFGSTPLPRGMLLATDLVDAVTKLRFSHCSVRPSSVLSLTPPTLSSRNSIQSLLTVSCGNYICYSDYSGWRVAAAAIAIATAATVFLAVSSVN